jgi:flagellar basal-body rod protein FlgB
MFIDDLINQGATPTLERMVRFTEARQNLLTEDVANVSTPGYRQKDVSVDAFQQELLARLNKGDQDYDSDDPVEAALAHPQAGILSHDGNNRSMEQLMSDGAKNALMHNTIVELLRRQYQTLDMALKGQPS